jgi:hypothetical protein
VDVENILSGIPITVGYSDSPNKYLTATRVNALVPTDQAKTPGWTMGQRFPTAAQAPYFDMNAFGYAASYTIGSLGARTLQAPGLLWMQCFATKSWSFKERAKLKHAVPGTTRMAQAFPLPQLAARTDRTNLRISHRHYSVSSWLPCSLHAVTGHDRR